VRHSSIPTPFVLRSLKSAEQFVPLFPLKVESDPTIAPPLRDVNTQIVAL